MSQKLTQEEVESLVDQVDFIYVGTLTICVMTLLNGAMVTGESNVIDPNNYDQDIGSSVAEKKALDKIWELEGYAIKTRGKTKFH